MNLIRPYGESAQNLSVAGGDHERRDVARRLISQSADMCLMCACALDSAVIEGGGLPLGTEAASVSQAVEITLARAVRDLCAAQEALGL